MTAIALTVDSRPPDKGAWLSVGINARGDAFVWILPSDDGTLSLGRGIAVPQGWEVAGFDPLSALTLYVPSDTWRLWRVHYALLRLRGHVLYRFAGWALRVLCGWRGVPFPNGCTFREAAQAIGEHLERERREAA